MTVCRVNVDAPGLVHADFARDYGIRRDELREMAATEFVELLAGLSASSRVVDYLSSATVRDEASLPQTEAEWLSGLGPVTVVEV